MFTKPFKNLSKTDADIAGGKGASLGEMLTSGIPVPDGFVVLSTTFDEFIHKSDLVQEIEAILASVDHKTISSVESASEKIQELIKHAEMPDDIKSEIESEFNILDSEFVAVRSSATAEDGADHAWAGQLESYLNTTKDDLLEKVQHCWASLFTPRAIFYRFEKGLDTTKISVAVVVQKMVNSEKSGIAFSVHPVTEDRNQIIIEAGFGLGEAIVSGSVTPDSYVITKNPREIIDINVSNQSRAMYRRAGGGNEWLDIPHQGNTQVFTESEILELSEIIMTIENHYGFPCDIEWAYESGKFYIVQSRPITTLSEVMGPKISFEKAYTRDTTMIIQQGWNACVTNPFYASGTNPHLPPVIHYMNDGVIEIWENEKATEWIMDSVQDLIKSDEAKLISLVDQYEKDLALIKEYWAKGVITDVNEFEKYIDRVFVVMKGFDCMYFPSVDERTPAHIRERMLKLRDADTYFDSNDKLMRASLIALYPELKGYENCILKSEIKNPPSLEILKARKKSFVVIGEEFAEQTTIKEYLVKHPEYHFHIEIPPADSNTLVGQVGNKGYAKGVVRIMKRKEQISEAEEGDIIVSTMTTPDFVPAMQKAAAIITDEGGVTCHAAIVARELNKPCIIGTKFATQILKDGDEVEVDADNGAVRIIEKSQDIIKNYTRFVSRPYSVAHLDAYCDMMDEIGVELGEKAHPIFVYNPDKKVVDLYFNQAELSKVVAAFSEQLKNESFFEKIYSDANISFTKIKQLYTQEKYTDTNWDEVYKTFVSYLKNVSAYFWMQSAFEGLDNSRVIQARELRTETEKYSGQRDNLLANILLDKNPILSNDSIQFIKLDEISKLRSDNSIFEILDQRSKGFIYFERKILPISEKEKFLQENKIKLVVEDNYSETDKTIKGTTAYKGSVVGKVRLIYTVEDFHKIKNQEDNIIVSPMTRPEFVTIMKDSLAIITDEGGVTCHAAIVARELQKPCVIGTKNATDILKDGDEVEVDADNGIVRIISNKDSDNLEKIDQFILEKGNKEYINQQGNMSIAFLGNACNAIQEKYLSQYDYTHVEPILVLQKGNQAICHFDLEMYRNFSLVSYRRIKDSVYSLPEYKKYQETISQINTEYNDFIIPQSNTDLKSKIKLYFGLAKDLIASTLFAEAVDHYIVEKLAKEAGVRDINIFTEVSTQATKPSFVIHFNELLLQKKDISWSFTNYFSAPTKDERVQLAKQKESEILINNLTSEIQKTNETIVKNKQSIQNLIDNASDEQRKLIEFIQAVINIRDERKEFVLKLFTMMSDVLRLLAENYSLSYEAISTLGDAEVDFLEDSEFIQLLEKRSNLGVANISYYDKTDMFTVDYDKAVKKIFGNIEDIKEIKGISANKGLYIGTVRIVLSEDIFDQFKEGEILVTGMTRAEYVPLMKKAGAIITDEGGVTCHAAIVSRELGVPCIIGTKFATQILKDGDEVEVDADNGVVRVISHNDKSVIFNKKVEEHSISISDWYQLLDKDHTKILEEDIYKRERLEIAHKHIGLPIDKCYKFKSIPEQEGIDAEYDHFFNTYKNTKCLVKLIPKSPELPKFRNYGILELVINEWYKKQPIQNINDYRVECFTMIEEGNGNYSIIFNVSEKGIFGVYTEGLRTIIVRDKKDTDELVNFSFDFKDYTYNTTDTQIIERINRAVSYVKVSKEKQKSLQDVMDCIFHQDYLEGYFELISNNVKGDYFIDWNRFLLQDADFSSKKEYKQEGQISGYSLSKGNFSGSVKLYSQATKNTYSKSDVLVCDFLDINMIQDLQSCGAILIEKGNVLSHMAIVAREFKKPCVIGVKFATKILKDGDMVEVDANKGVVTKLS